MRTYGRRILFISLTNTLLTDVQATLIAAMVYNLLALCDDEKPETLEMLRMAFKPETRRELQEAAKRSGVNVLSAIPTGQRCTASDSGPEPAQRYPMKTRLQVCALEEERVNFFH